MTNYEIMSISYAFDRGAVSDKMLSSINYYRDGIDWSTRLAFA